MSEGMFSHAEAHILMINPFMANGFFYLKSGQVHFQYRECLVSFFFLLLLPCFIEISVNANSVDPDQTPRSAASDLGLHCLPISILWLSINGFRQWYRQTPKKPVRRPSRIRLVIRRLQVQPPRGRQHSFVEIDHEIFSTVILSLPLIQEGQLSVSGERMYTILVNRLEDYVCPVKVLLCKFIALDMISEG